MIESAEVRGDPRAETEAQCLENGNRGRLKSPSATFRRRLSKYAALAVRQGANMEDMFGIITLLLIALGIGAVFFWVYRPMR